MQAVPPAFRPLSGIRVLDVSRVISGPLCTQSLADLGADVVKIETPGLGDDTRHWPPFHKAQFGAVFMAMNRNKRSLSLDLKTETGRSIARDMAVKCDILVENFSTGVAERLGLGYDELKALNPRLVYCTISGFGRDGPMKHSAGYDVILQAFSGMMAATGEEGGGYIRSPVSPIDYATGVHAFAGVLAALIERGRTGQGMLVELSLLDTALSLLGGSLQAFWETGVQPARNGSSHPGLCPYQAFDAQDGPIMIGVANDRLWAKFCTVAGLGDIANDNRFRSNADRVRHRDELLEIVRAVLAERPVAYWVEHLSAVAVPASAINTFDEVLDHPQTQSRGIIAKYPLGSDKARTVRMPIRFDHHAPGVDRPPPALGEHGGDILREFGFSDAQVDDWAAKGIAGMGSRS
ncbi:CaiB/BaiF CoA transferase family protein [Novosphingobium lentum]|uniref:CaiB/BaiF CoA transferase family protein n=1 Tax=Novosphingobium lentum TaxID=145287 RepID=UPI000A004A16|nr:CoA transferase [Novosphingobium lentum]